MADEWKNREWAKYVDLQYLPPQYMQRVVAAYDVLWSNPPEKQLIIDGYNTNDHTPVTINSSMVHTQHGDLSAGERENNTPGKSEIALDFEEIEHICIASGGKDLHLPLASVLSHEHHHIAFEERDIAHDMVPVIQRLIEPGSLDESDYNELKQIGVSNEIIALYRLQNAQKIPLDLSRLSTTQFDQLSEYVLQSQSTIMRKALNQVQVDKVFVERLLAGGKDGRVGVISVQEAEMLMQQVDNGAKLTLSEVENQLGRKFSTAELVDYLPEYIGAGGSQLSNADQAQLAQAMPVLNNYAASWRANQLHEEEVTVQQTDAIDPFHQQNPRREYANAHECPVVPLTPIVPGVNTARPAAAIPSGGR